MGRATGFNNGPPQVMRPREGLSRHRFPFRSFLSQLEVRMHRQLQFRLIVLAVLVMAALVAACQPAPAPTPVVEEIPPTPVPEATEAPAAAPTEAPAAAPAERTGAWVDQVVFTTQPEANAAVAQLQAGDIDIYGAPAINDPELFPKVRDDENLAYSQSFGSYNELTFNPAEFNDGRINPFTSAKIREAMNWLVDRNYIAQEIYGGLAVPKFLPITSAFPDYARYVDKVRELEAKYAYNPEKAKEVISAEMEAMGAELVDGVWTQDGEPITLVFLIRVEDRRRMIGDYVANQLESVGFQVDRQYKTSSEASALWIRSDPAEGQWHLYTGGWITTAISRDQGGNFDFFYTPRGLGVPLWQAYTPDPEFDEVSQRLDNNDFATLEERGELFRRAMELAPQNAFRVWLVDTVGFTPSVANLSVAYDLAGGVSGSSLWPYTIRYTDQEGGTVRWAQQQVLVEPWNAIAGTNWIYDTDVQRATGEFAVNLDPYTGLGLPNRVERAEVVAQTGTPMGVTLDWVSLDFQDEIVVPDDAWVDWDAAEQRFITAGESSSEPITARTKVTVYYPEDLYDTVKWHDGSAFSVADVIMNMILTFDRGKEESAIFDESEKPSLDSFMTHFKGVRIVSTDPLVIETYDDTFALDAENTLTTWWPYYGFGQASWHALAIGILAEQNQELAFSADKADALQVEWMSYVAGPSLEVLKKYLDQASGEGFIPYANTLGAYISADEAATRYANLAAFYDKMGHFWVGTGPFILDDVSPVEGTVSIVRNPDYPDPASKWAGFGEPKLATVELDGPGQVPAGSDAAFDVFITFHDEAYPADEIGAVKYLVFDATGSLVATGDAELVADGEYSVSLSGDVTGQMEAGAAKLEVAVSSKVVSIPSFASFEFVVVGQ
ncbi:MAG: ABC transporter substrate-binding protein [Chloroflexi bacterium]|nr:MAG: ABC transporter substrate-binding protein [Chloroflexota bacterium]